MQDRLWVLEQVQQAPVQDQLSALAQAQVSVVYLAPAQALVPAVAPAVNQTKAQAVLQAQPEPYQQVQTALPNHLPLFQAVLPAPAPPLAQVLVQVQLWVLAQVLQVLALVPASDQLPLGPPQQDSAVVQDLLHQAPREAPNLLHQAHRSQV